MVEPARAHLLLVRTVLDIMAELQTQRTREIAKIILGYSGGGAAELESPYENHSPGLGLGCQDPDSPVLCRPRAPSWHAREPRGARSVAAFLKNMSCTEKYFAYNEHGWQVCGGAGQEDLLLLHV